jgi:hypothetical protein
MSTAHPTSQHLRRWTLLITIVTTAVVITGGTAVWGLERHASGSNLRNWGDSLWWSVSTVTTTGYGEHYPVTVAGRIVAVLIMMSGMAILGAVAAVVAYGFTSRLTHRIEAAVTQVESEIEHVEADPAGAGGGTGSTHGTSLLHRRAPSLRALTVGVRDATSAAALTWLLARLGWHPAADGTGLSWSQGGVQLRLAVHPGDAPTGAQGRLTFSAGTSERLARIVDESLSHGFHPIDPTTGTETAPGTDLPGTPVTLRTASGFEVVLATS